nr:MAG TPA: hypothetical protein [Caudoviricetes sp.]
MTNGAKCLFYKGVSFLAYGIPMAALFFANRAAYVSEGASVGFFGYIIIAFLVVCFKNTVLEFIKTKTLLSVSVIIFAFSVLMLYLSKQMIMISTVSMIGSIFQSIFEAVADVYERYTWVMEEGIKHKNRKKAIPDKQAWLEAYNFIGE